MPDPSVAPPVTTPPRVLFVDDDPSLLAALARMFHRRASDLEFCFATSGADALELLSRLPVSVVVSDMRMPVLDGTELLMAVRDLVPGAARIVFSGQTSREAALRSAAIAHRFLDKPTQPELLLATIEAVLTVQRRLGDARLRDALGRLGTLPAARGRLVALEAALGPAGEGECAGNARVAAAVGTDVALTAKLLQLASSSFFTTARRPRSIADAVAAIGGVGLRCLVERHALAHEAPSAELATLCDRLATHSRRVLHLAEEIHGAPLPAEATLSTRLHDLGLLVAASLESDPATWPVPPLGSRRRAIGAYLVGLWGLPSAAVSAIDQPRPRTPPVLGTPVAAEDAVAIAHGLDAELEPVLHRDAAALASWADPWRARRDQLAEEES